MYTNLKVWLDHFEYHARRRCTLPEGKPDDLTAYEARLIGPSLAAFQYREQQERSALLRAAQRHEQAYDAAPLARIVELLIAEEQNHAQLLGAFMDLHGIPRKRRGWDVPLAGTLRDAANFELHFSTRMTAGLIGKVYLRALEASTGCRQLQTLCRMLVADELAHVGLESDVLRAAPTARPAVMRAGSDLMLRAYFTNASIAAWATHSRVLAAAGYDMGSFIAACLNQYVFHIQPPRTESRTMRAGGRDRAPHPDEMISS